MTRRVKYKWCQNVRMLPSCRFFRQDTFFLFFPISFLLRQQKVTKKKSSERSFSWSGRIKCKCLGINDKQSVLVTPFDRYERSYRKNDCKKSISKNRYGKIYIDLSFPTQKYVKSMALRWICSNQLILLRV